jgi:hypothetical protein
MIACSQHRRRQIPRCPRNDGASYSEIDGDNAPLCTRKPGGATQAAVAAAARCFGAGDSSPSQRTLTILETPGSCMVTP